LRTRVFAQGKAHGLRKAAAKQTRQASPARPIARLALPVPSTAPKARKRCSAFRRGERGCSRRGAPHRKPDHAHIKPLLVHGRNVRRARISKPLLRAQPQSKTRRGSCAERPRSSRQATYILSKNNEIANM
jgi:hypothetical protein